MTPAMDRMAPAPILFTQPSLQSQWSYRGEDKSTNIGTVMKPALTEKIKLLQGYKNHSYPMSM